MSSTPVEHVASLPSWSPGSTRDALLAFLDNSAEIAPGDRVAVFDNDGTLWCEKPDYPQLLFCVHELRQAITQHPGLASRAEYRALLDGDAGAMAELGLPSIALALAEIFEGMTPRQFATRARQFIQTQRNLDIGCLLSQAVYLPMLELLDALRGRGFAVFIVTGGGTEFVRAMSEELYGVAPEGVVGTLIGYEYRLGADGVRELVRTAGLHGDANEGEAKVRHIQQQLGRQPVFAAGNSAGDREMIEWACSSPGASLGLLVDHDDADREMAYDSVAGTFVSTERIVDIARAEGWVVASMKNDWEQVFASVP